MGFRSAVTAPAFWDGPASHAEAERFRSVVDAVDAVVYHLDADGYVLGANTALCEAAGYSAAELRRAHVSLLVDDETVERFKHFRLEDVELPPNEEW